MKLALCLEYPIAQTGGVEVLVQELVRGLAGKHELILVSGDTPESFAASGFAPLVAQHHTWNPADPSRERGRRLAEQLAAAGVQLAHFHFGGNYGWGNRAFGRCPIVHTKRRGIACVSTNHGAFSILDGYCGAQRSLAVKLALLPAAWLSKQFVTAHCFCEVAVSQNDLANLRRWYPPARGRFRQIYHSRLHGAPPPGAPVRSHQILCLGSIGARKGQTYLVESFARIARQHSDWKLIVAGRHADAGLTAKIKSLIATHQLGGRVLLQECVSNAEAEELLRSSAIFAMPSLMEGLGLALQEALFHGCACVASRAGGMRDLIQHDDNGLLAEPANVGQLAAALDRLIGDEALRRRFAARGPKSVLEKEMTAERMVGKYAALYEQILAPGRA
ncbi:MAG: glycosyltransferase family 4 protein [Verrucomicrobia bacterium]|nr:glycosyltransferase family 4 protein [Verrucomicrobiota bacterium]